jgi:hypothetical protein
VASVFTVFVDVFCGIAVSAGGELVVIFVVFEVLFLCMLLCTYRIFVEHYDLNWISPVAGEAIEQPTI